MLSLPLRLYKVYVKSWESWICYSLGRWDDHALATKDIKGCYHTIPIAPNLVFNCLSLYAMGHLLLSLAGFSSAFQQFTFLWISLPAVVISFVFYSRRYGQTFLQYDLSASVFIQWVENWLVMTSTTVFCWSQMLIYHLLLLQLEPLLPLPFQGCVNFKMTVVEDSLRTILTLFHVGGAFLLVTLPLWIQGYYATTRMVESKLELSYVEAAIEIIYQTAHAMSIFVITMPLAVLQVRLGLPFHIIHLIGEACIMASLNRIFRYKFSWQHQLSHEIVPLYHMTHIEHHLCKGIFSTTSPAGLWEGWLQGGSHTFSNSLIGTIPYALFQGVFTGFNIVSHTMWPVPWMQQWHPLHHVVHADIYNVNIPNELDMEFSESYKKHRVKLEAISPFFRSLWLPDAANLVLIFLFAALFHFYLDIGMFHAIKDAVWTCTIPL